MLFARRSRPVSAAVIALVASAAALAGPLSPPPGPITSTGKTLTEVEPRVAITSLGATISGGVSAYLTANMNAPSNFGDVILIQGSNVVLDLNGYGISGGLTGIRISPGVRNVTIRNGTIRFTGGSGIFSDDGVAGFPQAAIVRVENVTFRAITDTAVYVGPGSTILNVNVDSAGANGIVVGPGSTISATTVNTVFSAAPNGNGIIAGSGSILRAVSSRGNSGTGAIVAEDCLVSDSNFSSNTVHGVIMGSNTRLSNSTISSNGNTGVVLENSNSVGALNGFVESNSISGNGRYGVAQFLAGNALIRNNMIARNGDFGIRVQDNNQVIGNRISENGTAAGEGGLVVNGDGNLIQGNSFSLNFGFSWQLLSASSNCTILANTNRGSGGSVAGAGHVIAPVTSAAAAASSSTPNVNIQY